MKNRSGKIDPDYFNVEGTSVLFLGNEEGSMDVKFNRIAIIAKRYDDLVVKLKQELTNNTIPTSKEYNLAAALLLITKTGIRIGNESSAEGFMSTYKEKGKKVLAKTYGLTTLKQEHVKIANGVVEFDFTGKKHVENTFVLDKGLSKYLIPIVKSNYDPVFNITEPELTRYIKKFTSPYLSSKDFRTFRANVYAFKHAKSLSKPNTKKDWKEKAKLVYEHVAKLLNNTPAVTKSSYIDPALLIEIWGDPDTIETKKQGGVMNIPILKAQKGTGTNQWLKNWFEKRQMPEGLQPLLEEDKLYIFKSLNNPAKVTRVKSIDNNPNITGRYLGDTNEILLTENAPEHVELHERTHQVYNFPSATRSLHQDIVDNVLTKNPKGIYKEKEQYFKNPDEIHARVMVLRQKAGIEPTDDRETIRKKAVEFYNNYDGSVDNINDLLEMTDTVDHLTDLLHFMAKRDTNKDMSTYAKRGTVLNIPVFKKGNKICAKGKAWAKRTFDKYPSAYANMAASKYCKDPNYAKEEGGLLLKSGGELAKWRAENWTKSDGTPCGNSKAQSNPARCKPAAKWKTMSKSEKASDNAKKKAGGRSGKQFVSATKKGKVTKQYTKRENGGIMSYKTGGEFPILKGQAGVVIPTSLQYFKKQQEIAQQEKKQKQFQDFQNRYNLNTLENVHSNLEPGQITPDGKYYKTKEGAFISTGIVEPDYTDVALIEGVASVPKNTIKKGINEVIYRGLDPYGYNIPRAIKRFPVNLAQGRPKDLSLPREEAFRAYLQLPIKEKEIVKTGVEKGMDKYAFRTSPNLTEYFEKPVGTYHGNDVLKSSTTMAKHYINVGVDPNTGAKYVEYSDVWDIMPFDKSYINKIYEKHPKLSPLKPLTDRMSNFQGDKIGFGKPIIFKDRIYRKEIVDEDYVNDLNFAKESLINNPKNDNFFDYISGIPEEEAAKQYNQLLKEEITTLKKLKKENPEKYKNYKESLYKKTNKKYKYATESGAEVDINPDEFYRPRANKIVKYLKQTSGNEYKKGGVLKHKTGGKIAVFAYSHLMNNDNVFPILGRKPKQSEHHLDGFDTKKNSKGEIVLTPDNTKTTKGTKFYVTSSELTKLTKAMSPYKAKQIGGDSTYSKLITFYKKGGRVKMQMGNKFKPAIVTQIENDKRSQKAKLEEFNSVMGKYQLNNPDDRITPGSMSSDGLKYKTKSGGVYSTGAATPTYPEEYLSFSGLRKGVVNATKALTRPITITAAVPVAKKLQQLYKLPVSSGKDVKGAYRFLENTVDSSGKAFNAGDIVTESSMATNIPFYKYMMQPDKVKKALKETGDESALLQTNNPMFLRNSQAIEITGDTGEDLLIKGARMFGGASQAVGESPKAITNFVESVKPSLSGLKQALFGTPTDLSASLIYANKKGGVVSNKFPMYKKGGTIEKSKMACNSPKRTSGHPTKSHVVKACENGKEKIIRFGQQGVKGSPKKKGESKSYKNRRKSFKARHASNIKKGKMSAAYWANKVKWEKGGIVKFPTLKK